MKKLLLLTCAVLLNIAAANAQCTPDPQYTSPGIYPDSATGFVSGCEGMPYEEIITNVVPVDTLVELIPGFPTTVAFDSIVIVDFQGLPASGNLTYACSSTLGGCSFAGGEAGCVVIQGTPDASDVGTHNLAITVDVYVGGIPTASTSEVIDWYSIVIDPASSCTSGLDETGGDQFTLYPNPAETSLTLDGINPSASSITITNINGQVVKMITDIKSDSEEINISQLENGIYFVQIDSGKVIRFVKK